MYLLFNLNDKLQVHLQDHEKKYTAIHSSNDAARDAVSLFKKKYLIQWFITYLKKSYHEFNLTWNFYKRKY